MSLGISCCECMHVMCEPRTGCMYFFILFLASMYVFCEPRNQLLMLNENAFIL